MCILQHGCFGGDGEAVFLYDLFLFFAVERIAGCALTLAMRGFALQNDAGK